MPSLFDPLQLGAIEIPNRILMAPLTRGRATREAVPTVIMAEYYAQRASAGLIISEATGISRDGLGWPFAPGLWAQAQVEGWKPVTAAVHAAGGRIVAQLWQMGRLVHPDLGLGQPLSASVTTAPGKAHTYEGKKPYVEARSASLDDLQRIVADYARAARNAIAAGFDGVQIHGANGYLIDQFLRASGQPPRRRVWRIDRQSPAADERGHRCGRRASGLGPHRDPFLAQHRIQRHRRPRAGGAVHRRRDAPRAAWRAVDRTARAAPRDQLRRRAGGAGQSGDAKSLFGPDRAQ